MTVEISQVDRSQSQLPTTNRAWKGRGYVAWLILNSGPPIHISGMAEARAVKFITQVGYIKSYQRNKKSPPKECGYGHVTFKSLVPLKYIRNGKS